MRSLNHAGDTLMNLGWSLDIYIHIYTYESLAYNSTYAGLKCIYI